MRIGVVGVNYKLADLKLREKLAKTCLRQFGSEMRSQTEHHFITLSTCNRTEVYFCSDDLANTHTYILSVFREEIDDSFDQKLYSYFGYDCLLHLCRVTTGMDSAIVGETEIQGQVKSAYEEAMEHFIFPEELHYLFQKSLKIGKQVRSQLLIQRDLPDLEHAIWLAGKTHFKEGFNPKILFVGASTINLKALNFLKSKAYTAITITNRTAIKAKETAQKFACEALDWDRLRASWHDFDWVIFGAKTTEPLLSQEEMPRMLHSPKLLLDLGVPRNVSPQVTDSHFISLLNIDQLDGLLCERRTQMRHQILQAEKLIEMAAKTHIEKFHNKLRQREFWLTAV